MSGLEALRARIPEEGRDIRLNLQAVLGDSSLSAAQTWEVALACALSTRNAELAAAIAGEARGVVEPGVLEDASAAAILMGMNNVYYRFRHVIGKAGYASRPARLRMNRIAQPAASRIDFELACLAVSAINGCEACVRSHEQAVLDGGLTEDHVHDAVRIAATIQAAAVALVPWRT